MYILLFFLGIGMIDTAQADEAQLLEILGKIKQAGPAEYRYEESEKPAKGKASKIGKGYWLVGTDGSLVKLQVEPKRLVTTLSNQKIQIWDAAAHQQATLAEDTDAAQGEQIHIMHCIFNGHAEDLQGSHAFATYQKGARWAVQVIPKTEIPGEAPVIEISGGEDSKIRNVLLRKMDGTQTESHLVRTSTAKGLDYSVQRLIIEASNEKSGGH